MALPENLRARIPDLPVDPAAGSAAEHPPDAPREAVPKASLAACRQATKRHAKTFFFASHFLHKVQREQSYAVYAYCRHIDDLIDEPEEGTPPPPTDVLLAENRRFRDGSHPAAFAPAFARTCRERRIPLVLLDELVRGCCRDRGRVRIADRADLWEYCYLVASVVGLMMARVFGIRTKEAYEHAVEMGLAMQLTNILRDIAEDYERDRIYLPAEDLAQRKLSIEDLLARGPSDDWKNYLGELTGQARAFYRSAEAGIPRIADRRGARTALVMGRVYGGILDEIERHDFDMRQRRYVSLPRKIRLALAR